MNVGYSLPIAHLVSAISTFPWHIKNTPGDDLEREASLETIVVKLFLCFQSFCAESSSLLLVSHTKISLPSEVRNSLKQVFVDINSTLPGALFASHIIHIFVSYMYF